MSLIITATDFSDAAAQAVNYACQLASDRQADVLLLHTFFMPYSYTDEVTPMPVVPVEELMQISKENMADHLGKLQALYPTINISSKILYGDVVDSLDEYMEDHGAPWLVVLGNTGDPSTLFGNTTLTALRNLSCPVLAIPTDCTYHPVKDICFAVGNNTPADNNAIQQLISLAEEMHANLHVLTVNDKDDTTTSGSTSALQETLASAKPAYHVVANKNIDDGIQAFINETHMDWLATVPRQHSFFENLFRKSHTAAMVKRTSIPLIALHEA